MNQMRSAKPRSLKNLAATAAVISTLAVTAACGASEETAATGSESPSATESEMTEESTMPEESTGAQPAAALVGPGCDAYAKAVPDGAGSVAGMAQDPVAVAASNNPLLKTLVAAVSGKLNPKVDLVDTLNGDEFTVFAPVDEAFAKVPASTLKTLSKDDQLLTTILTYHVVPGQIAPGDITGKQNTVQGGAVTVTGSGDQLKVNGANVICGGVQTENATVYLIDSVLMPKA
jgi:uncharacterized surface protein with fasciclin (FAS1) repeats